MSERLKQKTAVVTGAGSGIGSAIASLFARQGARVALLDLTAETTEPLAAQLRRQTGQPCIACVADVTKPEQVAAGGPPGGGGFRHNQIFM